MRGDAVDVGRELLVGIVDAFDADFPPFRLTAVEAIFCNIGECSAKHKRFIWGALRLKRTVCRLLNNAHSYSEHEDSGSFCGRSRQHQNDVGR